MPSLLDIRRRVRAVKSTQQITKAMKMVAASKLRRAQERIQQARPFAAQMLRVLNSLASRVDPSAHPLLDERREPRAGGRALLFVITADRGLCGSFNTNVIKAASTFIAENRDREVALGLVGRRGRDYFGRRGFEVRYEQVNLFAALKFEDAQAMAQDGDRGVRQRRGRQRLPRLQRVQVGDAAARRRRAAAADPARRVQRRRAGRRRRRSSITYEPAPDELFDAPDPEPRRSAGLPGAARVGRRVHAAQMTAMDAATRNSAEMIEQLTLYMNKVRQAAITREIIEVVSGAQAL